MSIPGIVPATDTLNVGDPQIPKPPESGVVPLKPLIKTVEGVKRPEPRWSV